MFLNENGKFRNINNESNLENLFGLWFNILETDVNNDGLKDYLIGNIGENSKYKTSMEKPLKIFGSDFDGNGTHDLVLSYKYQGNYVPLRGKECSTQQMPFISEKIPTFQEFANASVEEIYGEEIVDAYERKVTSFESIILINKGENKFEIESLILNTGVRLDFLHLGKSVDSDDFRKVWEDATGLDADWKLTKMKFSPRFGLSFPITEYPKTLESKFLGLSIIPAILNFASCSITSITDLQCPPPPIKIILFIM